MLILPTVIIALSAAGGTGGLALMAKSVVDNVDISSKNRMIDEKMERKKMEFEACSEQLKDALESLGKQRVAVEKNYSVFINAFEQIHNRPEFKKEDGDPLPEFDVEELKTVSMEVTNAIGALGGAAMGSGLGAAAAVGTTNLVMALGKASTGAKIANLAGAAKANAALAVLGGGAKAVGGGGMVLGQIVLNAATGGVAILVEGLAMAIVGSIGKKEANKAVKKMEECLVTMDELINVQLDISNSATNMRRTATELSNTLYKTLVLQFKELVQKKKDWLQFSDEEKRLTENTILVVRVLNYLNNVPMYKVSEKNGEIEDIDANCKNVDEAIAVAKNKVKGLG